MSYLIVALFLAQAAEADGERIRVRIGIEIALRQLESSREQAEVKSAPVVDIQPQPKAKTYQEAYDEAYDSGKSLVVGIGIAPPAGQDWIGVQVKAPWHGQRSGFVISSPPVDGSLLWITDLPPGAGFDEIMDSLADWRGRQLMKKLRQNSIQVRQAENC